MTASSRTGKSARRARMAAHFRDGSPSQRRRWGFTLIELLLTVAIISVLAAFLLPVLRTARVKAKVARARSDLRSIATAIETYRLDWNAYPPARTYCAGGGMKVDDYNDCPPELRALDYLGPFPEDVFNKGHTYKYISPGLGYANRVLTILPIWVPEEFPRDGGRDVPHFSAEKSPVKWAIWSVGPSGPKPFWRSEELHYPVPRRNWYNFKNGPQSEGVIVHLSTGHVSP